MRLPKLFKKKDEPPVVLSKELCKSIGLPYKFRVRIQKAMDKMDKEK